MTYRLDYRPAAAQQTRGLPAEVFEALTVALVAVIRDPFEPPSLSTPDVHVRLVEFGGAGLASYYVNPSQQVVSVVAIIWTG